MITLRRTKPCDSPGGVWTLWAQKDYLVGRKKSDKVELDIYFPDDKSLSGVHAKLRVEHPLANVTDPLLVPTLVLTDEGSKHGTYANEGGRIKLAVREPMNLQPGDVFKFGKTFNEFKFEYTPLVVTHSGFSNENIRTLKTYVMFLGGHVVADWNPKVNYLVMESVTLTLKTICALLSGKYIVTIAFFVDMLSCVKTNKPMPNPLNYLPPLGDKNISEDATLEPIVGRAELFQDKVFVFGNLKHMKKMQPAVEAGGGTCKLVTELLNARDILKESHILMSPPDSERITANGKLKEVMGICRENKRMVKDSEIGMAAVLMSTEKNCNPYHEFDDDQGSARIDTQSQPSDRDQVIVPSTQQTESQLSGIEGNSHVNATLTGDETDGNGTKSDKRGRRHEDSDSSKIPPSKIKKRTAEETLPQASGRDKRPRTAHNSQKFNTQKSTLSSIFGGGGSSSEEEEEDDGPSLFEPSQPPPAVTPRTRKANQPNVVVDSDEDEEIQEDSSVFKKPLTPVRITRSSQSQSSQPLTPASSGSSTRSKRKQRTPPTPERSIKTEVISDEDEMEETESQQPQKKQKVKDVADMTMKTEKLKIKQERNDIETEDIKFSEVFVRFERPEQIQPRTETVDGKTIKNFKTFQKVLPLSVLKRNNSVDLGSEPSTSRSSRSGRSGRSQRSQENSSAPAAPMQLTFEIYECNPLLTYGERDREAEMEEDHRRMILSSPPRMRMDLDEEAESNDDDVPVPNPPAQQENTRRTTRRQAQHTRQASSSPEKRGASRSPRRSPRRGSPQKNRAPIPDLRQFEEESDEEMFDF